MWLSPSLNMVVTDVLTIQLKGSKLFKFNNYRSRKPLVGRPSLNTACNRSETMRHKLWSWPPAWIFGGARPTKMATCHTLFYFSTIKFIYDSILKTKSNFSYWNNSIYVLISCKVWPHVGQVYNFRAWTISPLLKRVRCPIIGRTFV